MPVNKELELFIDTIHRFCGYDLSRYSSASLQRRIEALVINEAGSGIAELIEKTRYDELFRNRVMDQLTVNYSQLFRDPVFFLHLKQTVLPNLKSYPRLSVWVAGCANGEEAYSLAILLHESGLLANTQIYATDISRTALQQAASGVLKNPLDSKAEKRYRLSGGEACLSDYFLSAYDHQKFKQDLLDNISFEHHDLTQQTGFISPQLILCRNVLIYFKRELQNKVLSMLADSIVCGGFLAIGLEENISFHDDYLRFDILSQNSGLYRKKYLA